MLGVSRQAVSKWELGEGYPEVEKLLILSNKLNISLDSLMTGSVPDSNPQENRRSCMIRVTSPNENVIMDVSKVMRSQEFRGRPLQILCKPPVWYRIEKSCRRKSYAKVQGQSGRTGGK